MNAARRVSPTETARILRKRLKVEFPGTKFSVRSERYAGGAAISVHWTDGPIGAHVQSITRQYEGAGFDGTDRYQTPARTLAQERWHRAGTPRPGHQRQHRRRGRQR